MMALTGDQVPVTELFRASMRITAASVSLVTATDRSGTFHGMAVTSAISVSMSPPSMLVAINCSASIHPIISETKMFCLNLMGEGHFELLESFSKTEMRDRRFSPEHWYEGPNGVPVLHGALASQICTVEAAHDYSTHTVFIGRVDHVLLPPQSGDRSVPLVWMNGSRTSIASGSDTKS